MSSDNWNEQSERFDDYDEDAPSDSNIQAILDESYDLLDGFGTWLEEVLELDIRTMNQEIFNAESLHDYLANYEQKSIFDLNEFDLRWFAFSHYVRKSSAEESTEARLIDSLRRYFEYLRTEHAWTVPEWAYAVLEDASYFLKRCTDYHELDEANEEEWEIGFRQWHEELEEDLDLRCLVLPAEIGAGLRWGDRMGWREAALHHEANRQWQEERQELLSQGYNFEAMRDLLVASYMGWMETPQDRLEDRTPVETILDERRDRMEDEIVEDER